MKIKVLPSDFVVTEVPDLDIINAPSEYKVYLLEKSGWDMFALVDKLARSLDVPRKDIIYGGIKDRHGDTSQYITIRVRKGLPDSLADKGFSLKSAGYSNEPVRAKDIKGNHFDITLRDIAPSEADTYLENFDSARKWGVPNYFDDQRFGSSRHGKGFMGKEIFLGDREKALKLFFTPSAEDRKKDRDFKQSVLDNWGKWDGLADIPPGDYSRIFDYLLIPGHGRSYTKVLSLIDRNFLLFILNVYQSYLYNEIVSKYIAAILNKRNLPMSEYPYQEGKFVFYRDLDDGLLAELMEKEAPMPGYDTVFKDREIEEIAGGVFAAEGITLDSLRVRALYQRNVHGKDRRVLVIPVSSETPVLTDDERYAGKKAIRIKFFLPKGSYATMVVKRMTITEWK